MRRRIVLLLAAGVLVAGVLVAAGTASTYRQPRPAGVLHDLARAGLVRAFAPRLSIDVEYWPCSPAPRAAGSTVPLERCGENVDAPLDLEALAAAGESLDPDSLRAAALAAVIWWDEMEPSQNKAVTLLEDARRLSHDPVPALVDLSAVHLVRAQRTQNARDLVAALDAAEEALTLDSLNQAARFNAALALQALAIDEQARHAWDGYLAVDSTSPWATEARERRDALLAPVPVPPDPTPSSTADEVNAFAARDPERARLLGWDEVLGEWGGAVLAGDAARAEGLLRLAEGLGTALERQGGDATLADAVRAARAARGDERTTHTLARAHRSYAAGQVLFRDPERQPATDSFAVVLRLRPPSPTLVAWARAYHAGTLIYAREGAAAVAVLDSLRVTTDSLRHPALLARVRWSLGTPLLRFGELSAAREAFAAANATFARLGEAVNFGATRYLLAETAYEQGDTLQAYRLMHQALGALRPYRDAVWLHGVLMKLAECAAEDGMQWAALRIQDEDVAVSTRTDRPMSAPEALLARARLRAVAGFASGAVEDLEAAAPLVRQLNLEFFTHTLRYSRAVVGGGGADGAGYSAELDSAVTWFAAHENAAWLLPTLMRRADLRLAGGDWAGADADLDSITARIRNMSRGAPDFHLRAAMMAQARTRFHQRVMLHVRAGRTREALEALDRGRVSFAPGGERAAPVEGARAAPGEVAVAYALIGDTLLTWTIEGTSVSLLERRVDRDTLLFAIRNAGAALETAARAPRAAPHLQRLYDWLVLPVLPRLGAAETRLTILADGEIAGVPFAALRDARRGRYLVQDHPLRFVASLADAARPVPAPAPAEGRVLLVANPAFDPRAHPTLDRLDGAEAEVDSLRRVYPGARVLRDADATADALGAGARGARVIHFAGHAVFNDAQPERSFLVLAGEGRLSAEAAASLDLGGVRLVVLSACSTLPSRGARSDGMAGLSGALLAAGAGGVVGSLWQVDDRLAQPLMLAFHRGYALGAMDPARALRQAQLAMLGSHDPARSSPAAWAAFRYVGR